jgi:aspartyl-tRNA synthetase
MLIYIINLVMDSIESFLILEKEKKISNDTLERVYELNVRIHKIRSAGKRCFIIFRQNGLTLQGIITKTEENNEQYNELKKLSVESTLRIKGKYYKIPEDISEITGCDVKYHEFIPDEFMILSKAESTPIQVSQIDNKDKDYIPSVGRSIELDYRYIALRSRQNIEIFKLKSKLKHEFMRTMESHGFIDVDFSKLIGSSSEGGSDVFEVAYFDKKAYLSQSPQLYKQMAINADFKRVCSIGSVFRAENSVGHAHLCEFTGLDFEMEIETSFIQIIDILWEIVYNMNEICDDIYKKSIPKAPVVMGFSDVVKIVLKRETELNKDFTREEEKKIGEYIKTNTGSDMVVIINYPYEVRPFYTMKKKDDKEYTYSYDLLLCGLEISSGSQREHRHERLIEQIKEKEINPDKLHDYLESFKYGTYPHGGAGLGFERLIALFTNSDDVRYVSFTPRDPKRITP